MAQEPQWLRLAKTLPAGGQMRTTCCSSDKSMLLNNGRKGYTGYCFRCRDPLFEPHGEHSLATLARRQAELALQTTRSVELPKDFTLNIPSDEAIWLYKAGIGADLARFYGIGYSLYLSRIVVPVYEDGQLTAFTARLQHGKPKYIEKSIDPTATVFVAAQSTLLPSFRDWAAGTGPDCVILEDNLSAIRVGRCVRRAVSLMGTSASHSQLAKALRRTSGDDAAIRKVSIWLDPDKAGRSASRSLTSVLRLQGYAVQEITSVKDPKFYTNREIKEILS